MAPRTATRRSVAKGAAWSVPTLAVASIAPALALSCPEVVEQRTATLRVTPEFENDGASSDGVISFMVSAAASGDADVPAGTSFSVSFSVYVPAEQAETPGTAELTSDEATVTSQGVTVYPPNEIISEYMLGQSFTITLGQDLASGDTLVLDGTWPTGSDESEGNSAAGSGGDKTVTTTNAQGCVIAETTVSITVTP